MKSLLLSACALLTLCSLASATPQQQLTRVLTQASQSANPSVSFLEGIGSLGNADLNAAQVAAAVSAAPIHPALRPVLAKVERIRISGGSVRFSFSSRLRANLAGRGYAHFSEEVSFQIDGRTLHSFRGFKLSQTAKGLKATPKSIRFGSEAGVPTAWVKLPFVGTKVIPLTTQTAELKGMTSLLRFG